MLFKNWGPGLKKRTFWSRHVDPLKVSLMSNEGRLFRDLNQLYIKTILQPCPSKRFISKTNVFLRVFVRFFVHIVAFQSVVKIRKKLTA